MHSLREGNNNGDNYNFELFRKIILKFHNNFVQLVVNKNNEINSMLLGLGRRQVTKEEGKKIVDLAEKMHKNLMVELYFFVIGIDELLNSDNIKDRFKKELFALRNSVKYTLDSGIELFREVFKADINIANLSYSGNYFIEKITSLQNSDDFCEEERKLFKKITGDLGFNFEPILNGVKIKIEGFIN